MIAALALLLHLLQLEPRAATVLAARLLGARDLEPELLRLVDVESRGVRVGVHTGHARRRPGRVFWDAAVRARWLRPDLCDEHMRGPGDAAGWGIRGVHGHAAAYAVRYLGACVPAAAIDNPFLSAVAAVRRLRTLEREYGLRDAGSRALAWRLGVRAARSARSTGRGCAVYTAGRGSSPSNAAAVSSRPFERKAASTSGRSVAAGSRRPRSQLLTVTRVTPMALASSD